LAFAVSDLHATVRSQPFTLLSVEYLYYHAVKRSSKPLSLNGISVKTASEALQLDGQPVEADWPYLRANPADLKRWVPPQGVIVYKRKMEKAQAGPTEIINFLDADRVSVLAIRISEAFCQPDEQGLVSMQKKDPDVGIHAVVAVGHGLYGTEPVVLVRNSWGVDWGVAGYGWLDARYLSARLRSISILS